MIRGGRERILYAKGQPGLRYIYKRSSGERSPRVRRAREGLGRLALVTRVGELRGSDPGRRQRDGMETRCWTPLFCVRFACASEL
jgi:hypothetical protein